MKLNSSSIVNTYRQKENTGYYLPAEIWTNNHKRQSTHIRQQSVDAITLLDRSNSKIDQHMMRDSIVNSLSKDLKLIRKLNDQTSNLLWRMQCRKYWKKISNIMSYRNNYYNSQKYHSCKGKQTSSSQKDSQDSQSSSYYHPFQNHNKNVQGRATVNDITISKQ